MNITIDQILKTLKAKLFTIIVFGLLCCGAAYTYMTLAVAPVYRSEARFYVESATTKDDDVTTTRLLAETFVEMLDSNNFFELVHANLPEELKDDYTASSLKAGCSFSLRNNTEVILVTFTNENRDSVVPVLTAVLASLQPHLDTAYGSCSCHLVENPVPPTVSSGKTAVTSAIAFIFGAFAVLAFYMIKNVFDVHVRSAADLTERYKLPIIGTVPSFDKKAVKKEDN